MMITSGPARSQIAKVFRQNHGCQYLAMATAGSYLIV